MPIGWNVESEINVDLLASLKPGSEIDGYRLIERLHVGGTAYLFRVEPANGQSPGYPLLMKVPKVGHDQPTESILGFETEAMILPSLHGTHVPRFAASGDLARIPHLTMEWVQGTSLAAIAATAPIPFERVAALGAAVADAAHSLHQQDTVHHDLKPDNIIIRESGSAVLLDFGFAHHAHFPDLLAEEKRYAAGSAPYVSPEQLTGFRHDARSDIFALGVVLYELATGKLPFGVPETLNAMKNRLWASPTPPRARVPEIPPWLQEIILRCLEVDPMLRYQSAALVAFDLRHPEQVQLTTRADLVTRAGFATQFGRWWHSREARQQQQRKRPAPISQTPVIMVAIDTLHPEDKRHPALQWTVRQLTSLNLEFRLICVSAIRAAPIGEGGKAADTSSGLQLVHKVHLRNWTEPLGLAANKLSLHVIESDDPATALLEFAKNNNVDLIVIGAPASEESALAWWRSAASSVTANAHCSVHVVRVPSRPREDWKIPAESSLKSKAPAPAWRSGD